MQVHRLLVAGASGALGTRLVPLLVMREYDVFGTSRDPSKAAAVEGQGAHPVIFDVFDERGVKERFAEIQPDGVFHLLTDLPFGTPAREMVEGTKRNARMRRDGTRNLVNAALESGVRKFLVASIAWIYRDDAVRHTEQDPVDDTFDEPRHTMVEGVVTMERLALDSPTLSAAVLRNGHIYGPGTGHESPEGPVAIHVDAAVYAGVLALEQNARGVFNIVDHNGFVSNEKARSALGWEPTFRIKDRA